MRGDRIHIRAFKTEDAASLLALQERNREFFRRFMTTRAPDFYTINAQRRNIERDEKGRRDGNWYSFGIFLNETGGLIGTVALTEVMRGPLQSCFIGYCIDRDHNGNGYATEAVKLAVSFGFEELKLARIEAGVMPHNTASMRVLEKCGFVKEGVARKSVEIDGIRQDHQMLAILADDELPT